MILRQVIIIILLCLAGIADICQAQVCPDNWENSVISVSFDSSEIPNFEKCFRLAKNIFGNGELMHWPYWLQIGLCHILSLLCFRETKKRKKDERGCYIIQSVCI